jgi:phosphodiester glycosidase
MYKPIYPILNMILLLVLIGTISSVVYDLNKMPSEKPVETPSQTGTFETAQKEGWSTLHPGLERRVIQVKDDGGQPVESLHIWRIDQDDFRLDVAFSGTPKSLENWQKESDAALVVNGGYFSINDKRYSADGLTILNGQASGKSFTGFGGMLAIAGRGAELRWLAEQPYDPSEGLDAALQSFPILVEPGGRLGFGAERDNHVSARRTVMAQDRDGRILFIVTPQGYFTLHGLSAYLTGSDLDLDIAVNLDGGGSTGLLVANPHEVIPSRVLLPFVILVYER